VLVTFSYWGWLLIWQPALFFEHDSLQRYLLYNEFLLIGILFGWRRRSDLNELHHEWVVANRKTLRQAFLGLFSVFLVLFALHDSLVSRSFLFSYLPWLYLSLLFCNYLLPPSLGRWAFSGDREERVALAGTVQQATQLQPWLERKQMVGLRTVGLICPEPCGGGVTPFPVLGTTDRMSEILREWSITQVILLDLSRGANWVQSMTQLCEGAAVRLLALQDLNDYFNHSTTTFEDDGVRFIGLREEPLESPLNRFIKRVLDLLIAAPVVVFILPISTLVVWLAQRLQSPGPIFFRQERTGMMGRPFTMYKYRTMHTNHNSDSKQACRNDPRVFAAGRLMRKFSIDELPQFLNVLCGHMSVVGPRPHLSEHEEIFVRAMRKYLIRKFIRPGITGWAQVKGLRGEIHQEGDIHDRVEADIYYLEHWSFSLDCLIILKTVKHCVAPPVSAY
jgi:putative colanic acid biosynthesis UDP-glucose lipid carrier transferase